MLRRGSFAKFQKKNLEVKKEIAIFVMILVRDMTGFVKFKTKNL